MQPQSPYQPQPSQYDFIMNHGQKPKRSLLGGFGRTQRLIIVGAVVVVVVIVLFVALSSLLSKGGVNKDALVALGKQEAEITRVGTLGIVQSKDTTTRGYILTAKLTMASQENQLVDFLKSNGQKVSLKDFSKSKNAENDKALDAAAKNNTYDSTITQIIKTSLVTYRADLKKEFDATGSTKEKQILNGFYSQTALLVK